ncbi:MAG: hypothetical protein ABI782_08995 [Anaerolineaceae bacterium]
MADKFEREIEEILAKLDTDAPEAASPTGREPISISAARRRPKPKAPKPARASAQGATLLDKLSPANLLFAGAGIVVGGLILSNFYGPLIWASFAGVILFLGAFLVSFRKSSRGSTGGTAQTGHYWRGQPISYERTPPSPVGRLRRFFGRK